MKPGTVVTKPCIMCNDGVLTDGAVCPYCSGKGWWWCFTGKELIHYERTTNERRG